MLIRNQKTWGSRLLMAMALVSVASVGLAFTEDDTKEPKGDAWPLNTCVVSGGELGSMGDPIVFNHEGREVRFCCKGCISKFKKDPAKYQADLAASYTYQTKCPVSGEAIDANSSTVLSTGETVYFCCGGCAKKFVADPAKYADNMAKQGVPIDPAKIKAAGKKSKNG